MPKGSRVKTENRIAKKAANKAAKKAARKTAKNQAAMFRKRGNRKPKAGKSGKVFSVRKGAFARLGAVVAANAGYRAKLTQTRVQVTRSGSAPNHPTFGQGDRMHFSYACREIRRTGDQNTSATLTDSVTGAIINTPKPIRQDDYIHIFALEDGHNPTTYRYDQGVSDTIWNWYDGTDAKMAMVSSCVFVSEEKALPIATQISDVLKYYETYFVREMWYEYKPTVPKTTPGNLCFAVLKKNGFDALNSLSEYEEITYDEMVGVNGHVETQVSAPCKIPVIKPWKMNEPLQGSGIEVDSGGSGVNQSNVLVGAVDTLLTTGQHDKLGTLVVHWTLDAYSKHWAPEEIPSDAVFLKKRQEKMLKRQMEREMFESWKNNSQTEQVVKETTDEFARDVRLSRQMLKDALKDPKETKDSGSTSACAVSSASVLKIPENRPLSRSMRTDLEALVKKMKDETEKEKKEGKEQKESKN